MITKNYLNFKLIIFKYHKKMKEKFNALSLNAVKQEFLLYEKMLISQLVPTVNLNFVQNV